MKPYIPNPAIQYPTWDDADQTLGQAIASFKDVSSGEATLRGHLDFISLCLNIFDAATLQDWGMLRAACFEPIKKALGELSHFEHAEWKIDDYEAVGRAMIETALDDKSQVEAAIKCFGNGKIPAGKEHDTFSEAGFVGLQLYAATIIDNFKDVELLYTELTRLIIIGSARKFKAEHLAILYGFIEIGARYLSSQYKAIVVKDEKEEVNTVEVSVGSPES